MDQKAVEREAGETPAGRLEIADGRQEEDNLAAQDRSSSYFSNFSSASTQEMRMKHKTGCKKRMGNGRWWNGEEANEKRKDETERIK